MNDIGQKEYLIHKYRTVKNMLFPLIVTLVLLSAGTASAIESCDVIIEPVDGCTEPGEQLKDIVTAFGVNFTSECNKHDLCYRSIGTSQSMCDAELLHNTRKACIEGPGGNISANIAVVLLSCALPTRLSETTNAIIAPNAPLLYNDFFSSARDNLIVRPGRQLKSLGEKLGSELVVGVSSASDSVAAEFHRIDENAKEFRDNVVVSLVDGLETIEGVLETVPGSSLLFSLGRPSEMLRCVYEETMTFARDIDLLEQLNPASTIYSTTAYPNCIVASNAMYNGPRKYSQIQEANGDSTIFENRQNKSLLEAERIVRLVNENSCTMTAQESGLFRPATNDAIFSNTIRSIFLHMANRPETSVEYDLVRRHASINAANWQFELIENLISGTSNLASLVMANSYERTRPGIVDLEARSALLADYSALESIAVKRIINLDSARIMAAQ